MQQRDLKTKTRPVFTESTQMNILKHIQPVMQWRKEEENPGATAGVFLKALDKTGAFEETMSRKITGFPHNFKQCESE